MQDEVGNVAVQYVIALVIALFKVYDNYITPLSTRVKCWKYKLPDDVGDFLVGMTVTEFTGPPTYIVFRFKLDQWDNFNVMEVNILPPIGTITSLDIIERLMKL